MRLLIQRVKRASVSVGGGTVSGIDRGLLVFIGIGKGDLEADLVRVSEKVVNLRIFEDPQGKMNLNVLEAGGAILSVPQFTLYADTRKGNRPGFSMSAPPDTARERWEAFNKLLTDAGMDVKKGIFGARMEISLVNDGPVTIWLDSAKQ